MDEHPGDHRIPLTLNKYLYANADPVNFRDPSGYMGLGSMGSAMSGMANMATMSIARYEITDLISSRFMGAIMDGVAHSLINSGGRLSYGNPGAARLITTLAFMCGVTKKHCFIKGVPVLVTGSKSFGKSTHHTSEHIWDALYGNIDSGNALPFLLFRSGTGVRNEVPAYMRRNSSVCSDTARFLYGPSVCDEYPFASTLQGGLFNYNAGWVSLRLVPSQEGLAQATLLRSFYRKYKLNSVGKPFLSLAIPGFFSFGIDKNGRVSPL